MNFIAVKPRFHEGENIAKDSTPVEYIQAPIGSTVNTNANGNNSNGNNAFVNGSISKESTLPLLNRLNQNTTVTFVWKSWYAIIIVLILLIIGGVIYLTISQCNTKPNNIKPNPLQNCPDGMCSTKTTIKKTAPLDSDDAQKMLNKLEERRLNSKSDNEIHTLMKDNGSENTQTVDAMQPVKAEPVTTTTTSDVNDSILQNSPLAQLYQEP